MLYRFSMCGRIWVPRPKINLPFVYVCRSQPVGGNHRIARERPATAMLIAKSQSRDVCSAASNGGRKGWLASAVPAPSEEPLRSKCDGRVGRRSELVGGAPVEPRPAGTTIWVTLQ